MPALVADIAAASRDVVVETWADASIAARYPSARDGSVTPADGYFDDADDAATVIAARGALIGVERRRFTVDIADLFWPTVSTGLPSARLIDTEQAVDTVALVSRIEVNLDTETTTFELFGGMSAPDGSGGVVLPPPPSDWLLSGGQWLDTGFWNDDALWVDGTSSAASVLAGGAWRDSGVWNDALAWQDS